VSSLQLTIPAQDDDGRGNKVKPREVREWLDNLPYLDLQRAARLASEQLRIMNRQVVASAGRLDMLDAFMQAYYRLADSLPMNPADAEAIQMVLKRLCQDIGFGYKIVVHQLVNKKSRLLESRNLSQALLGSIHALGLQLNHYYSNYQRAPRALWSECVALYTYARNNRREKYRGSVSGAGELELDASFRVIALLRLSDPYRLAGGMLPVLERYFRAQCDLTRIEDAAVAGDSNLPLPVTSHARNAAADSTFSLNTSALTQRIGEDINKLQRYRQPQALGLPPETPVDSLLHTLQQILKSWTLQPDRKSERQQPNAQVEMVSGLENIYCVINNGRCFDPALFLGPGHDECIDLGSRPSPDRITPQGPAASLQCSSLNSSGGGVAVSYRGPRKPRPRVGQLVALRRPSPKQGSGWVVAVCRWLVELESGTGFDMGVQYLFSEPKPIVIRPETDGRTADYQPAIGNIQKRGQASVHTLITARNHITQGSKLAVYDQHGQHPARCVELLDACPGFEWFVYERAD